MNPILKDYLQRFDTKQTYTLEPGFFTSYSILEYKNKLPYLYGIEIFCMRLYKALLNDEKVCIYSDYDTDAVTATATMYWGLIELGFKKNNLTFYAPDRFTEGYGMNPEAIKEITKNTDLIISVDCGINSTEEADIIRKSPHTDLLITDHHHLHEEVPKALAVINPRLTQDYKNDLGLKHTFEEWSDNVWNTLIKSIDIPEPTKSLIQTWKKEVYKTWESIDKQPQKFVSSSTTGVGVAWFCVVWLGYFLEEITDT